MAKDPAFLFYPGDWQGGTTLFTPHLKGLYIDLLISQFNEGPLPLEGIKTALGSNFGSWPILQKKFKCLSCDEKPCKCGKGPYFNERLKEEQDKRSSYSASRKKNRSSYVTPMSVHMEDVNEDINIIKNIYGEFKNVFLTDEQYQKLIPYCGNENNLKLLIGDLSIYIRNQTKDPYIDHYATLQGWWRRKASTFIEKKQLQTKTRTIANI